MEFKCWVNAKYTIPDKKLRAVVDQLRNNWKPEPVELFPHDLIRTAQSMGIGKLVVSDELESDDPVLTEDEIP